MQLRLQLQWRWQPVSLLQLLQRPVWLDAWVRGEEERAALLWAQLPNHVVLKILELRTIGLLSDRVEANDAQLCKGDGLWTYGNVHSPLPSLEMIRAGCTVVRAYDRFGLRVAAESQVRLRRRFILRLALAEGRVVLLRPRADAERRPCDGSAARWAWLLWP